MVLRARAWVAVVAVVGAALVAVPAGAQPVTVPGPDVHNDGFGDLAVGIPGEGIGGAAGAGAVAVLNGSGDGLASDGRVLTQGAGGVPGASEGGDRFGAALVAGRFNNDVYDDLAVGVPGEDVGVDGDAGAVVLLLGSESGLGAGGGRVVTQANSEPGDRFGFSVASGELTDAAQLIVGAPGEDVRSVADAGAVSVVSNPDADPDEELLFQGAAGIVGTAEPGDGFGSALAVGDFNSSDAIDSLAVGAPGEDVGDVPDAGVVNIRYAPGFGGPVGLRQFTQDRPEAGDRFGAALAHGSIDPVGGYADLAVGAPGETVGGSKGAGAVSLVLAGEAGFSTAGAQLFHQGAAGVPGVAEAGDGFGTAIAVGVFGDGGNALAVGVPAGEDVGTAPDAGLVDVLYNSDTGLAGGGRQQLTQADAAGAVEPGDRFGAALSGPFLHESDVLEDLGVGGSRRTGRRCGRRRRGQRAVQHRPGRPGRRRPAAPLPGHRRPGRRRRARQRVRRRPRHDHRLTPKTPQALGPTIQHRRCSMISTVAADGVIRERLPDETMVLAGVVAIIASSVPMWNRILRYARGR